MDNFDLLSELKLEELKREVAAVKACNEISRSALESGVVQEMVEFFKNWANTNGESDLTLIRSILTKLEGK